MASAAMPYRSPCGSSPCGVCPFRRASMPGWLGKATPESFIIEISMERPLPCHPTIDYEDPEWLHKWNRQETGRICAGSLVMAANMSKLPRNPKFPRLPVDRKIVFSTPLEFLEHHNKAPVKSWERLDGSRAACDDDDKRSEEHPGSVRDRNGSRSSRRRPG